MERYLVDSVPAEEALGVIQQVDVPGRALTVLVNGISRVFDMAPECAVVLHGEHVKLRLVQPLDQAHVRYHQTPEGLLAHSVEVDWWKPQPPRSSR